MTNSDTATKHQPLTVSRLSAVRARNLNRLQSRICLRWLLVLLATFFLQSCSLCSNFLGPTRRIRSLRCMKAASATSWELKRDQMILPAARVVTPDGTQGSAFVLASSANGTYVLTCHHVIKSCIEQVDNWDSLDKSSKKIERTLPVNVEIFTYDDRGRHTQTVVTSAEVIAYSQYGDKWDFQGDVALLKLRSTVQGCESAVLMHQDSFENEVRVLDEVVMVGCPDGSNLPLPTTGHIASLTEERAGVGLLLSQVFGNPGSSGSAVYRYSSERERYEIIALHSMTDARGSLTDVGRGNFLRLAVPAPTLRGFLQRHGYEHLVEVEEKVEEEPEAGVEKVEGAEEPSNDGDAAAEVASTSNTSMSGNATNTTGGASTNATSATT